MSNVSAFSQENWVHACFVLGRDGAAICLLLTDQAMQRHNDPVRSPGAYFRSMITRVGSREPNLHAAIRVTRDLVKAGRVMKIDIVDHIIIGKPSDERSTDYVSLRELGYFAV